MRSRTRIRSRSQIASPVLLFSPSVPRVLLRFPVVAMLEDVVASCCGQKERGGLLLGCYRGQHLEIVNFTQPGRNDRRELYRFILQDKRHERTAKSAWRESKETITNVGEWHSHPYGLPAPSTIDSESWQSQAKEKKRTMAFVIAAPNKWAVYLVGKLPWRRRIVPLEKEEDGSEGLIFSFDG
jgi:integrative and conjugative element protein (TIGR02256 family)